MTMSFPGMDPYLEHPILWTGVQSGLIHGISQQIGLALRLRYVTSIEERLVNDTFPYRRISGVGSDNASDAAQPSIPLLFWKDRW